MEASSHASALHRLDRVRFACSSSRTSRRITSTSTGRWRRTSRRSAASSSTPDPEGSLPRAAVNVGDPFGRELADELAGARRAPADVRARTTMPTSGPTGSCSTRRERRFGGRGHRAADAPARPLQRRERARGGRRRPAARASGRRDRARHRAPRRAFPGRFEAVDEGQPFAVLVDYAHTPDALANVLAAAREITARAARSASSGAAATATAGSGR